MKSVGLQNERIVILFKPLVLMFQMNFPISFWADVSIARFLTNCMPSSIFKGEIPFCILCPKQHLFLIPPKIIGYTWFVQDVRPQHTKLDPKTLKYIFLVILVFFEHSSFYSSPSFSSNMSRGSIKSQRMISLSTMLSLLLILFVVHLHVCLLLFVNPSLKSMIDDNLLQFHALPLRLLRHWIQKWVMIFLLLFVKVNLSVLILFPLLFHITISCLLHVLSLHH